MTTLLELYQSKIAQSQSSQLRLHDDAEQHTALLALNELFIQLQHNVNVNEEVAELADISLQQQVAKGVYLWGDVGRGKTFLMDLFFNHLKQQNKLRLHFHRFMAMVHQELNLTKGIADPLVHIARHYAAQYQVICFDEFSVNDIADAIILARLFEHLFAHGVILVATSNIEISRLYEGGLQRERFLPFIDILQTNVDEINLTGATDHRIAAQSDRSLEQQIQLTKHMSHQDFVTIAGQHYPHQAAVCETHSYIEICHRTIAFQAKVNQVIWFKFNQLCDGPRSALDYIELAGLFKHVIIDEVPQLGGEIRTWIKARGTEDGAESNKTSERQLEYATSDDPAKRFISLVDELYDQRVSLTVCSEWTITELYSGGALSFEFRRTVSRLVEMQRWLKPATK